MIYLASPYTNVQASVMEERFEAACKVAADYTRRGVVIYSPIVHYHPMAVRHNLPRDFAFWGEINKAIIDRADELHVLCLPGWEESVGVQAEMIHAKACGHPILFVEPF